MMRKLLAAVSWLVIVAGAPALAQQELPPAQAPAQAEVQLVGLPVYSSDGEKLGEVTEVGMVAGRQMVRADMSAFLGLGSSPVLIAAEMIERKADRVEVAMSAGEVRQTISKQKEQKEQREQRQ